MDQRAIAKLQKLQQSRVILIRHANSYFNHAWETISANIEKGLASESDYYELSRNEKMIDCGLSELGMKQS